MADENDDKSGDVSKISTVLDRMNGAGEGGTVSVGDIVESMRDQSFAPLLLVPALLLASPISGIPGTPTLMAAIIALIVVQMLMGRTYLWLPGFLSRRQVSAARMAKAVQFLRKPAAFSDRFLHARLSVLADRPASYAALLTCLGITVTMPMMEFLPFVASVAALAIACFAAGLLIRDGLLIIAGYFIVALTVVFAIWLI